MKIDEYWYDDSKQAGDYKVFPYLNEKDILNSRVTLNLPVKGIMTGVKKIAVLMII